MKNKLEIDDKRKNGTGQFSTVVGFYDHFMTDWGREVGKCDHSIALWSCDSAGVDATKTHILKIQGKTKLITFQNLTHAELSLVDTYSGHIHISVYDGKLGEAS